MKSYFTVVDGIFTNTNKCQVLLSELNTVVGDGWGRQRDRMMNCTFRFKRGMKIISNTSRSRWWCKHLTSLSLSNDECSSYGPQIKLPKTPAPSHPPPRVGTSKHLEHATVLSMTRHKRKIEHGRRTSGKQVRKEHLVSCKVKLNFDASGHSFKFCSLVSLFGQQEIQTFYLLVDPGHLAALNTHLLLRDEADDSSEADGGPISLLVHPSRS